MADTEHFNLAWNQFESCAASTFKNLLLDKDFADVTLCCEGDQRVTCHKVILSACSPLFRQILLTNPHQHPLIYLKGVKSKDLRLIIKFIYLGQIEIGRDCLPEFLATAKELEVKGLMEANDAPAKDDPMETALEPKTEITESDSEEDGEQDRVVVVQAPDWGPEEEDFSYSGESQGGNSLPQPEGNSLKPGFKSNSIFHMITPGKTTDGKFPCNECIYKATSIGNLKRHALSRHSGERVPCPICGKDFASKDGLKVHHQNKHEGLMFRCKLCNHEATTKSNLLRHMHKKHESSKGENDQYSESGASRPVEVAPNFSTEPEPPNNFYLE